MERHIVDPKIIMKDLKDILAVFKKYDVPIFLTYGALLGAVRDKDFIKWDDDVDLSVTSTCDYQTRKALGWSLIDLGFRTQPIAFNVFGRMEPSDIAYNGDAETGIIVCERGFKFTIFFFRETVCERHGREMVCIPKPSGLPLICTPSRFFTTPGTIKLHGETFITPSPIKEYLTYTYGDWKTPVRENAHATQFKEAHL